MEKKLTADDITPENFLEIPETKFSSYQEVRAAIRAINQVALAPGGELTRKQMNQRNRLLKIWDRCPVEKKIPVLEALSNFRLAMLISLMVALPAVAAEPLTAYDKFDIPSIPLSDDNPYSPPDLVALVHSYEPIKGKKVFYYRDADGLIWDTVKRIKVCNKHKVRDLRDDAVIHPKLERWRKRLIFGWPFWQWGTDATFKAATGAAIGAAQ